MEVLPHHTGVYRVYDSKPTRVVPNVYHRNRHRNSSMSPDTRRSVLRTTAALCGAIASTAGCLARASDLVDSSGDVRFEDASEARGFEYASYLPLGGISNLGWHGVYVNDFDRDGRDDVLVIGGDPDPRPDYAEYDQPKEGDPDEVVLFENVGGKFERSDALPEELQSRRARFKSAMFFDHDNDGWEDLLLLPVGESPLFLENVGGKFEVREVGFERYDLDVPIGATALDHDRSGYLDVFVIQNGDWDRRTPTVYNDPDRSVEEDNGNPNYLFRGDGSSFERADDAGIEGNHWSLATTAVDFTGDGYPDIHVANDYASDVLYRNRGDGSFDRSTLDATDRNGMSSAVTDVTGNGYPDVFVTNVHVPDEHVDSEPFRTYLENSLGKRAVGNNLLINQGDGSFVDEADEYGVREGGWGWAAVFEDFDNDGRTDLFHTTQVLGGIADEHHRSLATPMIWKRTDDRFTKLDAAEVGFEEMNGRGGATLDADGDGSMDIVAASVNGEYKLYENTGAEGNWLQIRVLPGDETPAIGAEVSVVVNGSTRRTRVTARTDFLSQSTRTLHFGLGDHESVDRIECSWPTGSTRSFERVDANQRLVVSPDGRHDEAIPAE